MAGRTLAEHGAVVLTDGRGAVMGPWSATGTGRGVVVAGAAEDPNGLRMFATALDPFGRAAWTWAGSPVDEGRPVTVATVVTGTLDRSPARTIPSPTEGETGIPPAPLSLVAGLGACGASAFLIRRR